jgi:hypothetical protein
LCIGTTPPSRKLSATGKVSTLRVPSLVEK